MEKSIFAFIWRYSLRQQLQILALTMVLLPIGYAIFQIPKLIVDFALGTNESPEIFGQSWDRYDLLMVLCAAFLIVVLIQGGLKYVVNVYAGVVAERELRRLRYQLYMHMLRFPLPHFRKTSQGELVQLINAEVEPLGGFVGQAVSTPGLMGGTLLTSLVFMFMQDPILGLAAIALYPLQIYLIPKLQAKVNELGKRRVRQVRKNAEKISETAASVASIRANDLTLYESARFSKELGKVFNLRFEIYKKKFLIKFINNFISQLGPFFFFSIGGYLVLQGDITIGALLAVIGAQKDIASPWKELLSFYQLTYDVKIKYEQVVAQFNPAGLLTQNELEEDDKGRKLDFASKLFINRVALEDEEGQKILSGSDAKLDLPCKIAIVGSSYSGKDELALMLANLLKPDHGSVAIGEQSIHDLPSSVVGRQIGFVSNPAQLQSGTIEDNLLSGLKYRPASPHGDHEARDAFLLEAKRSGNCQLDPDDHWIDYGALGLENDNTRYEAITKALTIVMLDEDVYRIGLRGKLEEKRDANAIEDMLKARTALQDKLRSEKSLTKLVEQFDPETYNQQASVAENLIFGTPTGDALDMENLAENPYVRQVLKEAGLTDEFIEIGRSVAMTMVELFADLSPDHEYFQQFSFIDADDLPEFKTLLQRTEGVALKDYSKVDQLRLTNLPFKLIVSQHRLGLMDERRQALILKARKIFQDKIPDDLKDGVEFFDPKRWNSRSSIQDNLIFGKLAYGQAKAEQKIAELIRTSLEHLDLIDEVMQIGLRYECGTNASRLTVTQRQKLATARSIMKKPGLLIMQNALAPLDAHERSEAMARILAEFENRSVIWTLQDQEEAACFQKICMMDQGKIVEVLDGGQAALEENAHA